MLRLALLAATLLIAGCSPSHEAPLQPTLAWTPVPVEIPRPTQALLQIETDGLPSQDGCFNDAEFVEDLTIPDLVVVEPGIELDKRWMVRNSGTCDWTVGYRLINVGGEGFVGPDEIALYPARAGASAELQIVVRAPLDPGEHISRWQARSPDGQAFGDEIFLYIIIPTPTPVPSAISN